MSQSKGKLSFFFSMIISQTNFEHKYQFIINKVHQFYIWLFDYNIWLSHMVDYTQFGRNNYVSKSSVTKFKKVIPLDVLQ